MRIRVLLCMLVFGAAVRTAHAEQFDVVAAGCVPDSQTLKDRLYMISNGALKFKAGATGNLQFHCAIPVLGAVPTALTARYQNPGTSRVLVAYAKGPKARHGDFTEIAEFFPQDHVASYTTRTARFSSAYGNSFIYWIKIELSRNSVNDNVTLFSVSLN
jgi:hypothetical protein